MLKIQNMKDIREVLVPWFINFLIKILEGNGVPMLQNEQLAEELHKRIIKKFKRRIVYSSFKDNIWGADLTNMQLISKFNKRIRFLLCVLDIFSKYAWVVSLKDKKDITIVNAFRKCLDIQRENQTRYW